MNKDFIESEKKKLETRFTVMKDKILSTYLTATADFHQAKQEIDQDYANLINLEKNMNEDTQPVVEPVVPTEPVTPVVPQLDENGNPITPVETPVEVVEPVVDVPADTEVAPQ